ncbi:hypothetical protein [Nitrosomonas sp. Nm33]|nr:hypothetical protein [Nitrosomonas sp. Nm33]
MSLQARMRRCSSLQGTTLRPHRALPHTRISIRSTPSRFAGQAALLLD